MQINRLRLVNFRQHAETVVEFERGLTGIIGANGAGKTTLLEAIAWAIYGTDAARGTKETIKRRGAPPRSRVEVELEFELGPHRYRVVRTLQQAQLYLDREPNPIANSVIAVTDRLTRLLGMTRDEFFKTYFTGQKELAIMAKMSAPERAQFLSRVLGYEKLRQAQQRLKERHRSTQAALDARRSELADPAQLAVDSELAATRVRLAEETAARAAASLQHARTTLDTLAPEGARWEGLQQRVVSLESDLKVTENRAVDARQQCGQLDKELAEALAARATRDELLPQVAPLPALREERGRLEAELELVSARRTLEGRVGELDRQILRLAHRLEELPDAAALETSRAARVAAQEQYDQVSREIESVHTAWVREKQDAETTRKQLLEQYSDLEAQRKRLVLAGPGGDCPTCSRPLGEEYESVMGVLGRQLAEVVFQGKYYGQKIEELAGEPPILAELGRRRTALQREVRKLTEQTARIEQQLGERVRVETEHRTLSAQRAELAAQVGAAPERGDETRLAEVRQQITALEPLETQALRLQFAAERAGELAPRFALAEQELSALEARVRELRTQLDNLGWSPQAFEAVRTRIRETERQAQQAELSQARATGELATALAHRAEVERRKEERERRLAEVQRLADESLLEHELDRALGDLRTELNDALRPDLSDLASRFIRDLTGGRYTDLELDEDYFATIIEDGEPKRVISGGEEDVANLALRLAISQMIAERAGQPLSLLILDEIFGSLDDERRASVMELLQSLKDRFPQVILITHIESVRDGFDQVIRLTYDVERRMARATPESRDAAA
jgi:exonuclease SbcC